MARLTCAAAASGAQIVVETHSDHVLNGVRLSVKQGLLKPDDVVLDYFSRGPTGIEIINPVLDTDGMVSQWPPGFFDEWDRAIDELLD
jgi:predicted ATPase